MRKTIAALAIALTASVAAFAGDTKPTTTPPASSARLASSSTVDMRKPLPTKLEIYAGQTIVFEYGSGQFSAKETDGKGKLFTPRPHNAFNQAAAFGTARVGEGEITINLPQDGLATKPVTKTIKVKVKPIPPNVRTSGGSGK